MATVLVHLEGEVEFVDALDRRPTVTACLGGPDAWRDTSVAQGRALVAMSRLGDRVDYASARLEALRAGGNFVRFDLAE